jgi:hypothetical protein
MRTFVDKQNQTPQFPSANLTRSNTLARAANREANLFPTLRRTIRNQAVQPLSQAESDGLEAGINNEGDSETPAKTRFGHDFSRIPVHAPAPLTIQAKLAVNTPGDIYEQEADHISEQVMRMPELKMQRTCAGGGESQSGQTKQPRQEHARLQTKPLGSSNSGQTAAPPIVDEVLASPGQPLDAAARAFFEPRFGHDFSQVRVHSGAAAEQSARSLNANAYTVGHNIVFGAARFAPQTYEGRRLIAHELTHVAQQSRAGGGRVGQSNGKGELSPISPTNPPLLQRDLDDWAKVTNDLEKNKQLAAERYGISGPRPLTDDQEAEARLVFGTALNTKAVSISEGGPMTIGGYARTLPNRIYFPDGSFKRSDFIPYLIHELTHVWQYQRGAEIPGMIYEALVGNYDYQGDFKSKEDALRDAWKKGKAFDEFTTEQQGDILSDYYVLATTGKDVSAYQGFVDQVRTGHEKDQRYSTVEPLPKGTLNEAKGHEEYRATIEAEIIRQLRLPMIVDDPRAITRSHRLIELFREFAGYWSGTYRDRIAFRRSDDTLVNLLFSQISRETRVKIFKILGVEPGLWK